MTYTQSDENASVRIIRYSFSSIRSSNAVPVDDDDILDLFSTPEEVMEESEYPFFLKHVIKQNIMYTTDVGFKFNGNIYYLKGGTDESMLEQAPIYESNKEIIRNLCRNEYYYSGDSYIGCNEQDLQMSILKDGTVLVSKGDIDCAISLYTNIKED